MKSNTKNSSRVRSGMIATTAVAATAAWWYLDSAPYPYAQRALLNISLPGLTLGRLDEVLQPRPGERMLEIGPGTGLQSLHVARQLGSSGRLDVVDIQQEMLDHVTQRAQRQNIGNIVATRSDAQSLPFEPGTFDAVYLITALGEIPDPLRVLREASRVLAPSGRLVVGEFFDRHWIPAERLHQHAEQCGLHFEMRKGLTFAYLARFRSCSGRAKGSNDGAPQMDLHRHSQA